MAGHSHWAQIKHKKAATDAKKSQRFSKVVREISVAALDGVDPEMNPRLRTAIDRARSEGVQKENIKRAITRSSGSGETANLDEFLIEATAEGGVMLLIEGITDNKNRTLAEIRHLLREYGASIASPGSVVWNFEKIGVIVLSHKENTGKSEDEIELAIIDAGAEDLEKTDSGWTVKTAFSALAAVLVLLHTKGISVTDSRHDYTPRSIAMEHMRSPTALLDALDDHNDVQEVYTNTSL